MIQVVNEQNCTGCRLCTLACSFYNTSDRSFSLSSSFITVERMGKENRFRPVISDDCIGCQRCVAFCICGVLSVA